MSEQEDVRRIRSLYKMAILAHPAPSEVLMEAAHAAEGQAIHMCAMGATSSSLRHLTG